MPIVYDNTFTVAPSEQEIASDFPGPPTVFEQTGIPFNTFGTGLLRLRINVDAKWISGHGIFDAYLYTPGHGPDQQFATSSILLNNNTFSGSYVTLNLTDPASGGTNSYIDFTGPGTAQSLYLYSPREFPDFGYADMKYQNLHVTVETLASAPLAVLVDNPPAGNINPTDSLVFEVTSGTTINSIVGAITNSYGNTVTAYNNGFVSPFTGTITSTSGGSRITLNSPYNWPLGLLTLNVTGTDITPTSQMATRTWTVVSGGGGGGGGINNPQPNGKDFSVLVEYAEGGRPLVIEPEII